MFAAANEISGVFFPSANHNRHPDVWLITGVSTAHFCFACCIEQLEDSAVLMIRKTNLLTELLSVLLDNETIWDVLCQNTNILIKFLEILLTNLRNVKDTAVHNVIIETILLICGKTPPFHMAESCINRVVSIDTLLSDSPFVRLLTQLCDLDRQVIVYLAGKITPQLATFLNNRKKSSDVTFNQIPFISLASKLFRVDMSLSSNCVKTFLLGVIEIIQSENDVESVKYALDSLQAIVMHEIYRSVLLDHEFSKFTHSKNSVIEALKKSIFSKELSIQLKAIKVIKTLAEPKYQDFKIMQDFSTHRSIVKLMLDKNINEYLLELLISSDEVLTLEVYSCLVLLMSAKACSKGGHSVFSLTPVLQTIKRFCVIDNKKLLSGGLSLLNVVLASNDLVLPFKTSGFTIEILTLSLKTEDIEVTGEAIRCFESMMKRGVVVTQDSYLNIMQFLYSLCEYLEKEILPIDFGKLLFEAVGNFVTALKSCTNTETKHSQTFSENLSDHEMLYYLADRYLISQAVLKFLPCKNFDFQSIFFQFLLCIIQLVPAKGRQISRKLAESAFLKFIYDFKVKAYQISSKLNETLAQILVELCLSFEEDNSLKTSMSSILFSSFCKLSIPTEDWKYLLTNSPGAMQKNSCLLELRLSVLALLSYGVMGGSSIIPESNLKSYLENVVVVKSYLSLLCLNSRRYFLYLWVHLKCNRAKDGNESTGITDLIESITVENCELLLMRTDRIVAWILRTPVDTAARVKYVKYYIESADKKLKKDAELSQLDVEMFSNLTNLIIEEKVVDVFIEVMLTILSVIEKSSTAGNIIFLIDFCIPHQNETALNESVTFIHRLFLVESLIKTENQMYLFKCFNLIQVGKSYNICEYEMKIFSRACATIEQHKSPFLMLELINTLNLLIHKCNISQNAMPLSILIENESVMNEFEKYAFSNENFLRNAKTSSISEQICAAIFFLFSQIIEGVNLFWLKFPKSILFNTDIFIGLLMETQMPVLLTSTLTLWVAIIASNSTAKVFQIVESGNTNSLLSMEKSKILFICLQNLCFHDDEIIKNRAVDCLEELVEISKETSKLADSRYRYSNAWCKKMHRLCLNHLHSEGYDPFQIRLLHLTMLEKNYDEKLCDLFVKFCENFQENLNSQEDALLFFRLLQNFTKLYLSKLKYEFLVQLKSLLYTIENELQKTVYFGSQDDRLSVLFFNNTVFIDSSKMHRQGQAKLCEIVKNVREMLAERISFLEEGETDSESGFN